jgi:2-polyprenyl-3-methyl-5-hydroxy-6-metoxy-1,4-benzoquinol methylase
LLATDFDPVFVKEAQANQDEKWKFNCRQHDMLAGPIPGGPFDAAYSLDVLEHIQPEDENVFLANTVKSLTPQGIAIFGMPSLESQPYASPLSKAGHVNCKNGGEFKKVFQRFFHNVFVFSMNDEVVHTGYYPMAHYLLALGCHPKLPVAY